MRRYSHSPIGLIQEITTAYDLLFPPDARAPQASEFSKLGYADLSRLAPHTFPDHRADEWNLGISAL